MTEQGTFRFLLKENNLRPRTCLLELEQPYSAIEVDNTVLSVGGGTQH